MTHCAWIAYSHFGVRKSPRSASPNSKDCRESASIHFSTVFSVSGPPRPQGVTSELLRPRGLFSRLFPLHCVVFDGPMKEKPSVTKLIPCRPLPPGPRFYLHDSQRVSVLDVGRLNV